MTLLNVEELDVYYGPVQALRGLNLRVDEGEMVALLGANGAGKTTTLRAISGLLEPRRGKIAFEGLAIAGTPAHKVVRVGIAHLPEGRELFPELTVRENLELGHWSRRRHSKEESELIDWLTTVFPRLGERASQAAATLSGGEQQMLAVARALMSRPKLLLIDELSLGLAPIVVTQLFEALDEVNRSGTAVLLVEQFVHLALKHSRRAYVLQKGEVVIEGNSKELLTSPELMAAYLGETAVDPHLPATDEQPKSAEGSKPKKTRTRR
jgi:branched-chain amino acid transport system ATP-binding protein